MLTEYLKTIWEETPTMELFGLVCLVSAILSIIVLPNIEIFRLQGKRLYLKITGQLTELKNKKIQDEIVAMMRIQNMLWLVMIGAIFHFIVVAPFITSLFCA